MLNCALQSSNYIVLKSKCLNLYLVFWNHLDKEMEGLTFTGWAFCWRLVKSLESSVGPWTVHIWDALAKNDNLWPHTGVYLDEKALICTKNNLPGAKDQVETLMLLFKKVLTRLSMGRVRTLVFNIDYVTFIWALFGMRLLNCYF